MSRSTDGPSRPFERPSPTEDGASLDDVPRRATPRGGARHRFAGLVLRLGGWTPAGAPPDLPKYVIVAAPHTALADGFWMMAFAWWWELEVHWLVKASLVRGPLGGLLRAVGAIPVERASPQGLVELLAAEFRRRPAMLLSIPPEGTRARRDVWKSGFYHVARAADVPVCLSYLDYATRRGGFGPCIRLSGDPRADMDPVRAFYRGVRGAVPSRFTPPRLREEDPSPTGSDSDPA